MQLHYVACNFWYLLQVDVPLYGYRDIVRMIDDMVQVYSLQTDHGGWNDDMALVKRGRGREGGMPLLLVPEMRLPL